MADPLAEEEAVRFAADLPPGYDYHAMFHGTDEHIPVAALHSAVRVMDAFLATSD